MGERIDRALAALGIEHLAERPPETLSGGEQQRVAIAAALAMAAPLLVLDEAAAELDPAGALALAELLRALAPTARRSSPPTTCARSSTTRIGPWCSKTVRSRVGAPDAVLGATFAADRGIAV